MVSTVVLVDSGGATEFRHHDYQCAFHHAAIGKITDKGRKRLIKFAELFQMEIEIFIVCVVVGM